jgi:hypothetical protein
MARRVWARYVDALRTHPRITNSLTACVVGGAGDALAQSIEYSGSETSLSGARVARVAAWGLTAGGVPMFYWFRWGAEFSARVLRSMAAATHLSLPSCCVHGSNFSIWDSGYTLASTACAILAVRAGGSTSYGPRRRGLPLNC